jgi:hypothetical protein
MRFNLKKPCKNCPFRNGPDRIIFRGRDRAAEIAESAYRNGFPCHLSAEYDEGDDDAGRDGGYVFGEGTQHCAGALAMFAQDQWSPWPGIDNDEDRLDRIATKLAPVFPDVFESEEAFIEANRYEPIDGPAISAV